MAGEDCHYCHTQKLFKSSESTSFRRISRDRKELFYEQGSAGGYISTDKVCLGENVCVDDMLFIDVDDTDQVRSRYNGVLGLSPGSSNIKTSFNGQESNSYLQRLYDSNLIDKKLFSMYLSDNRDPKD